jgi:hypothetical protein
MVIVKTLSGGGRHPLSVYNITYFYIEVNCQIAQTLIDLPEIFVQNAGARAAAVRGLHHEPIEYLKLAVEPLHNDFACFTVTHSDFLNIDGAHIRSEDFGCGTLTDNSDFALDFVIRRI